MGSGIARKEAVPLFRLSPLLKSALLTTALSLLLRLSGLLVNSRLAALMGAEGMGLLQLALNVETLAVALAASGIRFSVTRLVAEELSPAGSGDPEGVMRAALRYALGFGGLAALLLIALAPAAAAFAGDRRLTLSLLVFAPGLPCLAAGSVFAGYFTAVFRPWKASFSQAAEQLVAFGVTLALLPRLPEGRPELCCAVFAFGASAADLCSLGISYILYKGEGRGLAPRRKSGQGARLLRLSLPLAFSSYARTALSTLQHLLVPRMLRRSGASAAEALSVYGVVGGMVFPVLGFASVFFGALSDLLIPELTGAQLRGDRAAMERTAGRILSSCLLFSAAAAAVLFLLGPWLGRRLYRSAEAGSYLRLLAPLVTVMYLDSVVDGMLKGLGLQLSSMFINLADAVLTLASVCFLLPRFGVRAYIAVIYLSECFNFLLSWLRLRRAVTIKLL
ncbi:MAG: oligosaccharide flippase family protein [Oscillospiraceae bacterium]|nr:oligosaccharide flippase family protein [Oscillospiraceae bacterium]MBR4691350.1 oligosaccharide flippase family protein [Oscillospiraceae bacterium]